MGFTTLYISLPLRSELVVVDRGGLSESKLPPSLEGGGFSLWDGLGGVRGLSEGDFARGDSLSNDPVSLSLSQQLELCRVI